MVGIRLNKIAVDYDEAKRRDARHAEIRRWHAKLWAHETEVAEPYNVGTLRK
jgi:hypothetical protein